VGAIARQARVAAFSRQWSSAESRGSPQPTWRLSAA
jgi:hypothetical protein